MFPYIDDVSQLLNEVSEKKEFKVNTHSEYISIDYKFMKSNTFETDLRKECRGIKFYRDGSVAARPFHKFFNVSKLPSEGSEGSEGSDFILIEKIDGSLVHPFWSYRDQKFLMMTKAGVTDISRHAQDLINDSMVEFFQECEKQNITPIFEFVSPNFPICLHYEEDQLFLLAMRYKNSGEYVPWCIQKEMASQYSLNLPRVFEKSQLKNIPDWKNTEGVVIRYSNGEHFKLKTEFYLSLPSMIGNDSLNPRFITQKIIDQTVDDEFCFFPNVYQQKISSYADKIWDFVINSMNEIENCLQQLQLYDDKYQRVKFIQNQKRLLRPILFDLCNQDKNYNRENIEKLLCLKIQECCRSKKMFQRLPEPFQSGLE